ncbi:transcription factor TFIIIC subunit tfc4 [Dispira simplex]|nr:transcription factor TFIIIC subunit tfc4 [Dispira simplex]
MEDDPHGNSPIGPELSESELVNLLDDIIDNNKEEWQLGTFSRKVAQIHLDSESDAEENLDDLGVDPEVDPEGAYQSFRRQFKEASSIGTKRRKKRRGRGKGSHGPRLPPLSPELRNLLGYANMQYVTQDYDGALSTLQEVIRISPKVPQAWTSFAMIQDELGDRKRALMMYLVAAHITPNDTTLWNRLGHMSLEQNDIHQALYCFSKTLQADNTNQEALIERCQIHLQLDKPERAVSDLQLYLVTQPWDLDTIRTLARICADLKKHDIAIAYYERFFFHWYTTDRQQTAQSESTDLFDPNQGEMDDEPFTLSDLNIFAELCMLQGEYEKIIFHLRHGVRYLQQRGGEMRWNTPEESDAIELFRSQYDGAVESSDQDENEPSQVDDPVVPSFLPPSTRNRQSKHHVKLPWLPPTPAVTEAMDDFELNEIAVFGEYLNSDDLACIIQLLIQPDMEWGSQLVTTQFVQAMGQRFRICLHYTVNKGTPRLPESQSAKASSNRTRKLGSESEDEAEGGEEDEPEQDEGAAPGTSTETLGVERSSELLNALEMAEAHDIPLELRVKLGQAYLLLQQPEIGMLYLTILWGSSFVDYIDLIDETIDVLMRCAFPRAALAACEIVLSQEQTSSSAPWSKKAMCYRELGDLEKAIECLTTAVSNDPQDLEGQLSLAELYQETGDNAQALHWFQRVEQSQAFISQRIKETAVINPTATPGVPEEGALFHFSGQTSGPLPPNKLREIQRDAQLRRLKRAEKDVELWFRIVNLLRDQISEQEGSLDRSTEKYYQSCVQRNLPMSDRERLYQTIREQRARLAQARSEYCDMAFKLFHHFRHTREFFPRHSNARFTGYRAPGQRLPTAASLAALLNTSQDQSTDSVLNLSLEERINRIMRRLNVAPDIISVARGQHVLEETPLGPTASSSRREVHLYGTVSCSLDYQSESQPTTLSGEPLQVTETQVVPALFRGIHFDEWRRFFINYTLQLIHLSRTKEADRLLDVVSRANIYRLEPDVARQFRNLYVLLSLHTDNFDLAYPVFRNWITNGNGDITPYRLFAIMTSGNSRLTPFGDNPVVSKLLFRYINAMFPRYLYKLPRDHWIKPTYFSQTMVPSSMSNPNDTLTRQPAVGDPSLPMTRSQEWNTSRFQRIFEQLPQANRQELQALLMTLRAHIQMHRDMYSQAAHLYRLASEQMPHDPLLQLYEGIAVLHRAMQRRGANRHHMILEAFKHLYTYFEMIMSGAMLDTIAVTDNDPVATDSGAKAALQQMRQREALYNLGRAFQHIGLDYLAVPYYETVLGLRSTHDLILRNTPWTAHDLPDPLLPYAISLDHVNLERVTHFITPCQYEAAYNLSRIYLTSGNPHLAQAILMKFCTV